MHYGLQTVNYSQFFLIDSFSTTLATMLNGSMAEVAREVLVVASVALAAATESRKNKILRW